MQAFDAPLAANGLSRPFGCKARRGDEVACLAVVLPRRSIRVVVATRLAISRWRRARKALRAPDRAYATAAPFEPGILHVALTQALQKLPATALP